MYSAVSMGFVYDVDAMEVPAALTPEEEMNNIWRSVCSLICFDIVEMHRLDRVLRQFDMIQSIPSAARDGDELHTLTRQRHRDFDWGLFHIHHVQRWENCRNLVISAELHDGVHTTTPDYRRWYERCTVLFISLAARGTGFRTGDATFRRLVSDDAAVLMHRFEGMSTRNLPLEVGRAMEDTTRIGQRLYELANRQPEQTEENEVGSSRRSRIRRHQSHDYTDVGHSQTSAGTGGNQSVRTSYHHSAGTSYHLDGGALDYYVPLQFGEGPSQTPPDLQYRDTLYTDPATRTPYMSDLPDYKTSPVPFPGFSQTQLSDLLQYSGDDTQPPPPRRRGERRRPRHGCGTEGHY